MKTHTEILPDVRERDPRASKHAKLAMLASANGPALCYAAAAVPPTDGTNTQKMSPDQQNQLARNLIFSVAKPIIQAVRSQSFAAPLAGQNTMVVNPLQIGFLRRFIVVVSGTVTNTGAGNLVLTPNGADTLLTNITFNDFTGNPRHNASGRSFSMVEAAKYNRVPGAAYTSDSVSGFGSIIPSNVAPTPINNGAGAVVVTRVFEIPIMVDTGKNMAGGMWLGVNNQSTSLNLTINPNPIVTSVGDPLQAIYQGSANNSTGTLTNVTVTVYQDYWNNVPMDKNNDPILPINDVSTAYMITETNSGLSFAVGQPAQWNYPTFSKLLGTYFTYDNGATALNAGTDITTIRLVVSNYSIIREYSPLSLSRVMRDVMTADPAKGSYAITSRMHNLDVSQYPSLQLQITPSSAPAGTYALITTELLRPMQYMASASGVGGA